MNGRDYDLNELLHPAQAFDRPSDVVNDPDLTLNEKRAILASWASDACAIEAVPELRSTPAGKTATFFDIMEALRQLDRRRPDRDLTREARKARWQTIIRRGRRSDDDGPKHAA